MFWPLKKINIFLPPHPLRRCRCSRARRPAPWRGARCPSCWRSRPPRSSASSCALPVCLEIKFAGLWFYKNTQFYLVSLLDTSKKVKFPFSIPWTIKFYYKLGIKFSDFNTKKMSPLWCFIPFSSLTCSRKNDHHRNLTFAFYLSPFATWPFSLLSYLIHEENNYFFFDKP